MPSNPKPPAAPPQGSSGGKPADPRQERLAQALRDNLKKRKAQQRERARPEGGGDGQDDSSRGQT